jgi:hypothetical protein
MTYIHKHTFQRSWQSAHIATYKLIYSIWKTWRNSRSAIFSFVGFNLYRFVELRLSYKYAREYLEKEMGYLSSRSNSTLCYIQRSSCIKSLLAKRENENHCNFADVSYFEGTGIRGLPNIIAYIIRFILT